MSGPISVSAGNAACHLNRPSRSRLAPGNAPKPLGLGPVRVAFAAARRRSLRILVPRPRLRSRWAGGCRLPSGSPKRKRRVMRVTMGTVFDAPGPTGKPSVASGSLTGGSGTMVRQLVVRDAPAPPSFPVAPSVSRGREGFRKPQARARGYPCGFERRAQAARLRSGTSSLAARSRSSSRDPTFAPVYRAGESLSACGRGRRQVLLTVWNW